MNDHHHQALPLIFVTFHAVPLIVTFVIVTFDAVAVIFVIVTFVIVTFRRPHFSSPPFVDISLPTIHTTKLWGSCWNLDSGLLPTAHPTQLSVLAVSLAYT